MPPPDPCQSGQACDTLSGFCRIAEGLSASAGTPVSPAHFPPQALATVMGSQVAFLTRVITIFLYIARYRKPKPKHLMQKKEAAVPVPNRNVLGYRAGSGTRSKFHLQLHHVFLGCCNLPRAEGAPFVKCHFHYCCNRDICSPRQAQHSTVPGVVIWEWVGILPRGSDVWLPVGWEKPEVQPHHPGQKLPEQSWLSPTREVWGEMTISKLVG